MRVVEAGTNKVLITNNVPYGSFLKVKEGDTVKKGDELCFWDPYNAVILSEFEGIAEFDAIEESVAGDENFEV